MASGNLTKFPRALIASMMITLLLAQPVAAAVAPVLAGPIPSLSADDPSSKFSEEAHAQALLQLGFRSQSQEDACMAGGIRAQRDTNGTMWFLGGCIIGFLALGAAYIIEPSPPASALVGMDDQYVALYTDCYREQAQSIQQKQALYGCLTGAAVGVVAYVLLFVLIASTSTSDLYY